MKKAIELAIAGGYLKQNGAKSVSVKFHKDDTYEVTYADGSACHFNFGIESSSAYKFIDPLFWQALGKAMEWEENIDFEYAGFEFERTSEKYDRRAGQMSEWMYNWHRFIDHLAEGKDAESFFSSLTNNKE